MKIEKMKTSRIWKKVCIMMLFKFSNWIELNNLKLKYDTILLTLQNYNRIEDERNQLMNEKNQLITQ